MSNRRTSLRARKQVDYAHSDKDFEDDDEDFASSSAKRTKSETKQQVKEDKKKNNSDCENKVPQQGQHRLPLDEKLFEQDLQAALQLSKQSTEDDKDGKIAVSANPLSTLSISTANNADDADDNDDDDYNVDGDDDDADDSGSDYAGSDSDDSVVKTSKKKEESKSGRGRGRVQKTDLNKPAAGTKRSAAELSRKSQKERVGLQTSANKGSCKLPSYTRAAVQSSSSVSRGSAVMSPSSGLRLGLSRNVKVKPLHPSVHVTM